MPSRQQLPLGRDSVSYRVAMEPMTGLASAGRALLLQVAHPSVAAGVADHSDYESAPWTRLFRTLEVMRRIAFADPQRSAKAARMLRGRHAGITGTTEDGQSYRALDPDLLVWVWATLVQTQVVAYERFVRPMADSERARFYEEWLLVARACGVPEGACPASWPDFEDYVGRMIADELRPTGVAQRVAAVGRRPPLPFPLSVAIGGALSFLAAGQLPRGLRDQLGYRWSPAHRLAFDATATASRWVTMLVPGRLRRLPLAVAEATAVL